MRSRFNPRRLNREEPFDPDWALQPHLVKHETFSADDVLDVLVSDPIFYPAREDGPADWLMVADVPGRDVLVVPLMPSKVGLADRCWPIGIYRASPELEDQYWADRRHMEGR